jgi:hypothetical protein
LDAQLGTRNYTHHAHSNSNSNSNSNSLVNSVLNVHRAGLAGDLLASEGADGGAEHCL